MKQLLGVIVLTIAAFSISLGQTPEQKPAETQPTTTPEKKITETQPTITPEKKTTETQATGEKVSSTASAEQALISLDKEWGEAGSRADTAVLERILADDFMGTSATGAVATKAQNIADAKTNAANITNATYTADEYTVRFLDKNTAVMTHRAVAKGLNKGKEFTDQHRSLHVFVKRDGKWQVVASQATPIPETSTPSTPEKTTP